FGTAFPEFRYDLAVLGNDHFPFVASANEVRLIDDAARALFAGDVLELRADQFALDSLSDGGRCLSEADLALAGLGRLGGVSLRAGATAQSDRDHRRE